MKRPPRCSRADRPQAGFTLVEVLLSGVIGAVLLTAVSYATLSFTVTVAHLEEKAGVTTAEDIVMRRMTRDIREAWWVEIVATNHLKIADENGEYIQYLEDENHDLVMIRQDGEEGVLLENVEELVFEALWGERLREGTPQTVSGDWLELPGSGFFSFGYDIPEGSELALGFGVPVESEDLPGGSIVDEEVQAVSADVLSVPLAWVPGTEAEDLHIAIYKTRGPGLAKPVGSALGSLTIAGSSLPLAVEDTDGPLTYEAPDSDVALSLSGLDVDFEPGAGYALVLSATGDAQLVFEGYAHSPGDAEDLLAVRDGTPGSQWVDVPINVNCALSGVTTLTDTASSSAITSVSITLTPDGRPTQTRSATVLSQTVSDSPWYGVLPGEQAP